MKNKKIEIKDITVSGEGVGSDEGKVVFVDNALPEEKVLVSITKDKKNYKKAKLLDIIQPSINRVDPPCQYFYKCGGCQIQHADISLQEKIKTNKVYQCLKRIGEIKDPVVRGCISSKDSFSYRNKIVFPLQEVAGRKKIGFYKKRSHEIVSIQTCLLHISFADTLYQKIRKILLESDLSFFDERRKKGDLQHLMIRTSLLEKKILIGLIGKVRSFSLLEKVANKLFLLPDVKGVIYGRKEQITNSIYPEEEILLYGEKKLNEEILGVKINISLFSFFQVNKNCAEMLYAKAYELAKLEDGDQVLDAYSGIGTFAIFLAKKGCKVTAIESFAKSVEDAKENSKKNGVDVDFIEGEVEDKIHLFKGFRVVFLNPPRKGLHEDVIKAIGKSSPNKIVYTSCDPATLARDVKRFSEYGFIYKIAVPFDMFPQTIHVETVVLLEKNVAKL